MQIITIENYIFKVEHNITGLNKNIYVNYDKQNTITQPIYTHLGGCEETLNFEATILLKDMADFAGFEELVKLAKPLKISAFDLVQFRHILINSLQITADNFVKSNFSSMWYYTKNLKIDGILI